MTTRTFILALVLTAYALCAGLAYQAKKAPAPKPKPAVKIISFKKDVAPVMKSFCLPCHTEDQMNPSELYLDSYDNLMAGGKHGKPFLAGKPDSSLIVQKMSAKPPFGDPMPMKLKRPFPADTLKILADWILQGGKNN